MVKRRGFGIGLGKGYYNLVPKDSYIHSLSAKGVKTFKFFRGGKYDKPSEFSVTIKAKDHIDVYKKLNVLANQKFKDKLPVRVTNMSRETDYVVTDRGKLIGHFLSENETKRRKLDARKSVYENERGIYYRFPKNSDKMWLKEYFSGSVLLHVYNNSGFKDAIEVIDGDSLLSLLDVTTSIGVLNQEDYNYVLRDALDKVYFEEEFPRINEKKVKKLLDYSSPKDIMNKKEYEVYKALPDEVIVYRGLQSEDQKPQGLSWSLSPAVANFFANRWARFGIGWKNRKTKLKPKLKPIFMAKIDKRYIYIYNNDREEEEVLLDSTKLKDVKTTYDYAR